MSNDAMNNPFLDYANEIETRSDAQRQRRAKSAQERARKKALAERDLLFRLWKKEHKKRKAELLKVEGAQELADFLEHMTDSSALLAMVRPWQRANCEIRFQIFTMISQALTYQREKVGLEPFDDPLPYDDLNVFLIIREMLR